MESVKHECGVAMIRLLKPLEHYQKKYGTWLWGLNKLYLLMEKQHNRGQEGAGLACVTPLASPLLHHFNNTTLTNKFSITVESHMDHLRH